MRTMFAVLAALLLAGAAHADPLDDAKSAGQVAEGPDGYLHVVDHGTDDVDALVKDINSKRKARYKEIADSQNIPIDAVAVQAGKKLLGRVPEGQYVMDAEGHFKKR